eukprot:768-Pelagococcus_subviridis.AAC.7
MPASDTFFLVLSRTSLFNDGCIPAICKRTGTAIAEARHVILVPTESFVAGRTLSLGHQLANSQQETTCHITSSLCISPACTPSETQYNTVFSRADLSQQTVTCKTPPATSPYRKYSVPPSSETIP